MSTAKQPHLVFCCELPTDKLVALFDDRSVLADLVALGAEVSLALLDLSPDRAGVVRRLNEAGVPVVAWLVVDESDGYFLHSGNAPQATNRYKAFRTWAAAHDLRFVGVALDVEPDKRELEGIGAGKGKSVARLWLCRLLDRERLRKGLAACRDLLARIRADGYRTESFQFSLTVEDREAGATFLQRLFGVMDLRVDREWLMLYTSFLKGLGLGMLWHYAGGRCLPFVGSTESIGPNPPLTWDELSRDLRLARRWGDLIGIFDLEGCVRQGFLARLKTFYWDEPAAEPEVARRVARGLTYLRAGLFAAESPTLALAALLLLRQAIKRPSLAAVSLLGAWAYHRLLRPRLREWGATSSEAARTLPGDELVANPRLQHTRAITIQAPPRDVWPWLVQMGFNRGGYYYPGWVDALWGWLIRRRYKNAPWYTEESVVNSNADRIVPELQELKVGDHVQDGPDGFFEVRVVSPELALVLYSARHPLSGRSVDPRDPRTIAFVDFSWAFVLEPIDELTTRLIVRLRADHTPGPLAKAATYLLIEPGDWLMRSLMFQGIRERVERDRGGDPS